MPVHLGGAQGAPRQGTLLIYTFTYKNKLNIGTCFYKFLSVSAIFYIQANMLLSDLGLSLSSGYLKLFCRSLDNLIIIV